MMKLDVSTSNNFGRPRLLLFELAHQVHPFVYAVNIFLRPGPDDCLNLIHIKLKDAIDQRFTRLDPNTVQQSSQLLESIHQSLLTVIQQQIDPLIHNGYTNRNIPTASIQTITITLPPGILPIPNDKPSTIFLPLTTNQS
ncbi:unnamed protein product [Rotaria socialis]|uniref:Uncharacterized protein n=1 Tax=Rotaria socialis TaxID=392032 RepID=A0A818K5Q3_9BILA|nr:unnamed protein product [Rotaria socialis]